MLRHFLSITLVFALLAGTGFARADQHESFLALAASSDVHRFRGLHQETLHFGHGALSERKGISPNYLYAAIGRLGREGFSGHRYSIGFGWRYRLPDKPRMFLDFSFAPTYLSRDYYPDAENYENLGTHFHFSSRFALGWQASAHVDYLFQIEHLSNGGIGNLNPGTNQVGFALSFDL